MAVSQEDYMRAIVDDESLWKPMPSFFTPGTPLYNEEGGAILKGPRKLDAAKRLLGESGYAGQPVTSLMTQDIAFLKAFSEVAAEDLKRIGINVDFVATDWGTLGARRAQKSPPTQGGWNLFPSWSAGVGWANPATYAQLRANGSDAWFGWPNSPRVEAEIAAWFDAKTLDEEKVAARRINQAAFDDVIQIPLGLWLMHQAWRKNVAGIVQGPLPFFWGVSKTT
jgi:peptide/nickel transport system substrate-binding protein